MKQISIVFSIILCIFGCSSGQKNNSFPQIINITELKNTDFVATFETPFDTSKNTIYAATMPFAWNEIKNKVGPEVSDFTSKELEALNNTKSHIDTLKPEEYQTSIAVEGTDIIAKAYFRKSLPFEEPLTKFEEPLEFKNTSAESFGFRGKSAYAKINYFNNQDDFSISLLPKNNEHEIILIVHHPKKNDLSNFNDYFDVYNQQKQLEKNQQITFNHPDIVEIPIIEFNLEKNFTNIVGSSFKAKTVPYFITKAYQQNGFILNEKGAEVESYAQIAAEALSDEGDEPEPKRMIFNQPFVVLLKRKDAQYPYFGVYIANEELLKASK